MEQELVDQIFSEKETNQTKADKKQKIKEDKHASDSKSQSKGKAGYKNEYTSAKLDLESNGGNEDDYSLDSTTPGTVESQSHKKGHYEKVGSLKNKDSARSTSATLFALDSSRVDAQLLKSEMPKLPIYLGRHIPLLWIKNRPVLTIGPHWPYTLCLWFSIAICGYLLAENIAYSLDNKVWYYILYAIVGLLLFFFTVTALLNPGIATERESEMPGAHSQMSCPLCEIVLDNTTFHCFDCSVCIRGFDHHCPWTSKCIGANNVHVFYAFVGFFFLFFLYSMVLCIVYAF